MGEGVQKHDLEMMRVQITKEVFAKFDAFVEKLHADGCGAGKLRGQKWIDFVNMEYENFKDDLISKYGSVQAAQRMLFDEILPKMRTNMVDMAGRVAACEIKLEESHTTTSKLLKGAAITFGASILLMAATGGLKLWQDWVNQRQTATFLSQLTSGVKIIEIKDGQIKIHKQGGNGQ